MTKRNSEQIGTFGQKKFNIFSRFCLDPKRDEIPIKKRNFVNINEFCLKNGKVNHSGQCEWTKSAFFDFFLLKKLKNVNFSMGNEKNGPKMSKPMGARCVKL